jgi:N-acetylneuraminate synthase
MPKEGYSTVTLPNNLVDEFDKFIKENKNIVSRSDVIKITWMDFNKNSKCKVRMKQPVVKIGNRLIGDNNEVFVIAEIGINHNGDIELAKKLIDVAVEAGCDAVKFQKRNPDKCVPEHQKKIMKETPWGMMTYLDYKKKIEFEKKEYDVIDAYCKSKKILWFVSVWDEDSVDFMQQNYDTPCFKIPSALITDKKLLARVKKTGKPVILSTGMSTLEEVKDAIKILGEENTVIMQCNSTYPSKLEELNLRVIETLRNEFFCPIGYSGHETGIFPTEAAAVLGAKAIERHITLDRSMWGTDQSASLEPQGLTKMVRDIRVVNSILGDGVKKVYESELPIRKKLRGY